MKEFKFVFTSKKIADTEEELKRLDKDGWSVVSCTNEMILMSREIKSV